jgi:hypothetical protein
MVRRVPVDVPEISESMEEHFEVFTFQKSENFEPVFELLSRHF